MLNVHNLNVHYGRFKALDNVSIQLPTGGRLAGIIGPNGAGKTTLMDAITGRRKPSQGKVTLDGEDITFASPLVRRKAGISRSFQRTSIFPDMTIGEQLELVAAKLGEPDLAGIVDTLGLTDLCSSVASQVAYGDQRRVDIALALIGQPRLLFLDEPAAGLSTAETQVLFEHLSVLVRSRGVSAMVVEHDVDAVFRYCDDIAVLNLGQLLATGTPAEIRQNPEVIKAYLGTTASQALGH